MSLGITLERSVVPLDEKNEEITSFICYVCDRTFSRVGFLKAHFQRSHPDSPFPSELFRQSSDASVSRKSNPIKFTKIESSHQCEICNKSFSKRIDLSKHSFIHRRPVKANFQTHFTACDFCKKVFGKSADFKKHYVKCELCSVKHCGSWLYQKEPCKTDEECLMCKRELCDKCHTLHQTSDISEKSYECVVCKGIFNGKINIKSHYADSHAIVKVSY